MPGRFVGFELYSEPKSIETRINPFDTTIGTFGRMIASRIQNKFFGNSERFVG